MVFKLYNDSPSLMKPGVYQSGLPEIWTQEHYDQAVAMVAGGSGYGQPNPAFCAHNFGM